MTSSIPKCRIEGGYHFRMEISEEVIFTSDVKGLWMTYAINRMRLQMAYQLHGKQCDIEIKNWYDGLKNTASWNRDFFTPPARPLDWSERPVPKAFTFARPSKEGGLELEMVFGGKVVEG